MLIVRFGHLFSIFFHNTQWNRLRLASVTKKRNKCYNFFFYSSKLHLMITSKITRCSKKLLLELLCIPQNLVYCLYSDLNCFASIVWNSNNVDSTESGRKPCFLAWSITSHFCFTVSSTLCFFEASWAVVYFMPFLDEAPLRGVGCL